MQTNLVFDDDRMAKSLAESAGEVWETMPEEHRNTWRKHANDWRKKAIR